MPDEQKYDSAGSAAIVFFVLTVMVTVIGYFQAKKIELLEQRITELEQSNADR